MNPTLVKIMGWKASVLEGDPTLFDLWMWLRRHVQSGPLRTLDIECGRGCFSLFASSIGNQVLGVDSDPGQVRDAEAQARLVDARTAQFFRADPATLPELITKRGFEPFDQIIFCEASAILERHPSWLRGIAELLRPGGRIILTAHYKFHKPFLKVPPKTDQASSQPHGFTHEDLLKRFKDAGLNVTAQDYLSGVVSQQLMEAARTFSRGNHSTVAWSLVLPLRLLQVMDSPVTKFTRHPHLNIGVVGIRPTTTPAKPKFH